MDWVCASPVYLYLDPEANTPKYCLRSNSPAVAPSTQKNQQLQKEFKILIRTAN